MSSFLPSPTTFIHPPKKELLLLDLTQLHHNQSTMQFTNLLAVLATSLFCTSALASEPCNGRSVWKHPGDCHAFYQCDVGGVGVFKTCGDNQAFHPEWNACGPITPELC